MKATRKKLSRITKPLVLNGYVRTEKLWAGYCVSLVEIEKLSKAKLLRLIKIRQRNAIYDIRDRERFL
jgi:hypothetical protein